MFHKLLIPIDDSRFSEQATHYGFDLAKRFGSSLTLLHVVEAFPEIYQDTEWLNTLIKQREAFIHQWQKQGQDAGIPIEGQVVNGDDIAESIVHFAQDKASDLIVMGTHGRKGLAHAFLGSVSEQVTRLTDIPVLLIRDHQDLKPIRRILLAVDGSPTSRKALQYADTLTQHTQAELHVVHVIPDLPLPILDPLGLGGMVSSMRYAPMLKELEQEAKIVTEVAKADLKSQKRIFHTARAQRERVADVIVRYAKEQQCDLIVMGTHGRTGLNQLLLGSVAQGVAHQTPAPLLLIHHNP